MISFDTLSEAVETGVLTADQAARLRDLEEARTRAGAEPEDAEKLRFISGFADVFVTLGLALFLGAAFYFFYLVGGPLLAGAGLAVSSWMLAEFFTRRRRMALPSIVLLVTFAGAIFGTVVHLLRGVFGLDELALTGAGIATVGAAVLHYQRFKVPITIAAGAAAAGITVYSILFALAPGLTSWASNLIVLALGLTAFTLAMRHDMADPERVTRSTDIAFWLHLLAAPLIVHPLISGMIGYGPWFTTQASVPLDVPTALAILAAFLALGLVAVAIDRRALLVSGLIYAGSAFATLLRTTGISDLVVPATILCLGAFVLLLSAGWVPLRSKLLPYLPGDFARRLPHPLSSRPA